MTGVYVVADTDEIGIDDHPMRECPISAVAPGVLRKIFEFNTGRQPQTPLDSFSTTSPQN